MSDLHKFARAGDPDRVLQAIAGGRDINEQDEFGATALHYAIAYKHEDVAILLLERGADPCIQGEQGWTSLHCAVEYRCFGVAEAIVRANTAALSIEDDHGNEPLWTAAFNAKGDYRFVVLFVGHGADPRHINRVGLSPITIAERFGDPGLSSALVSGDT